MRTDRAELRGLEDDLDRVEDRLHDDISGLFRPGPRAQDEKLASVGLPERAAIFWRRHDGLSIAHEWSVILPLAKIVEDEPMIGADGARMRTWKIGHYAGQPLRLAQDPWLLGAELFLLDGAEEGGEAGGAWVPWASSLPRGVRVMLALTTVLFTDRGALRRGLTDPRGNLLPEVERRILRRQLDIDDDAPHARLQLAIELADQGEEHGALRELRQVVKRAPSYEHAWLELGWTAARVGRIEEARRALERGLQVCNVASASALLHASLAALVPTAEGAQSSWQSHRERALALSPDLETLLRADSKAHLRAGHKARAAQLGKVASVLAGATPSPTLTSSSPANQRATSSLGPATKPPPRSPRGSSRSRRD